MVFDDVVAEHIHWIARQAFVYCKSKADAEDLAQETLVKILSNRDKYDSRRDFKPWALAIMANTHMTQYRRRSRAMVVDAEDEAYSKEATETADGKMLYADVVKAIRKAARLSVGVECVLLYAKGYSYDEIADMLGIGIGTVKSRISAGRKLIRSLVE